MYEDLVSGGLGSPGLVDAAFGSGLIGAVPSNFFADLIRNLRPFFIFVIQLMQSLSLWIRSTPIVLAVIAMLFAGFIVAIFMRVYHSA